VNAHLKSTEIWVKKGKDRKIKMKYAEMLSILSDW
jgi:hypothetical protein